MSELVEWISAQLDADEAMARACTAEDSAAAVAMLPAATFAHVVAWGPARVLVEVEAKRAIVAKYVRAEVAFGRMVNPASSAAVMVLAEVVQHMACVFADRPGFDETWRP